MKIEWEDNELTNCVLVDKDGYFDKMKVPKEMLVKYPDMNIGFTTNGVLKIKLPLDHDSSGSINGVLYTSFKVSEAGKLKLKKMQENKQKRLVKMQSDFDENKDEILANLNRGNG